MAQSFMMRAFEHQRAKYGNEPYSRALLETFQEGFGAASTVNAHAPYIDKFSDYCREKGGVDFPIKSPWFLADYLAQAADGDQTVSPTRNRLSAIAFACKALEMPNFNNSQIFLANNSLALALNSDGIFTAPTKRTPFTTFTLPASV